MKAIWNKKIFSTCYLSGDTFKCNFFIFKGHDVKYAIKVFSLIFVPHKKTAK